MQTLTNSALAVALSMMASFPTVGSIKGVQVQEDNTSDWSLEDHLREGSMAIAKIKCADVEQQPHPICHHFSEVKPIDVMGTSREETYEYLAPIFASAAVQFVSDRLEAWETASPHEDWLVQRIPQIFQIAGQHALVYEGWTWEPAKMQPIGACTFTVVNNRSR